MPQDRFQDAPRNPKTTPRRLQEASEPPKDATQQAPPKHPRRPRVPQATCFSTSLLPTISLGIGYGWAGGDTRSVNNCARAVAYVPICMCLCRSVSLYASLLPFSRQFAWASALDGLVGIRETSTICFGTMSKTLLHPRYPQGQIINHEEGTHQHEQ